MNDCLIGYFVIAGGIIILGAYSFLLGVVLANRTDLLPNTACTWCCYGPCISGCIESYRQEKV